MTNREPFISTEEILACVPGHSKLQQAIRNLIDAYGSVSREEVTGFDFDFGFDEEFDKLEEFELSGYKITLQTEEYNHYDRCYNSTGEQQIPANWLWEPHLMDEEFARRKEEKRVKEEEEKKRRKEVCRLDRKRQFLKLQEEFGG